MFLDGLKIVGTVLVRYKSARGIEASWERKYCNLVVNTGLGLILSRLVDDADNAPSHMAMGDSGVASAAGMTALQGVEHQRVAFDSSVDSAENKTVVYSATFGAGLGSSKTVKEFGILNAAAVGTMLCRFLPSEFTIFPGDTVEVIWTLRIEEDS